MTNFQNQETDKKILYGTSEYVTMLFAKYNK